MHPLWCNKVFPHSKFCIMSKNYLSDLKKGLLFFFLICVAGIANAQPPTITSFSPLSAKPGDAVTITGTGFNTTTTNNVVFFGATRATVTAATATGLTATVPSGATYSPITVLNTGTSLAAYSRVNFNPIYSPAKTNITANDFLPKQDFTTGNDPTSLAIGDLDGDGKPIWQWRITLQIRFLFSAIPPAVAVSQAVALRPGRILQ
jgi:hypothetical protein